ncbi:MAG: SRPBCC domain-containing protein [Thermoplasmata archaeon]|nr:SRPBCC domain-containing protein [Thermoplasmata archaeon]
MPEARPPGAPSKPPAPKVASLAPDYAFVLIRADLPRSAPGKVFDCWARPELLTKWWPEQAKLEFRVGGKYRYSWPGADWHLGGAFIAIDPPKELAFSWRWEHHPESTTVVKVSIAPGVTGGTTLFVRQGPYTDAPGDVEVRQSHIDGWIFFLPRLEALAAPLSRPRPVVVPSRAAPSKRVVRSRFWHGKAAPPPASAARQRSSPTR